MEYILILLGVGIVGYVIFKKHKDFIKDKIKNWL
jgi:hypothetical protein